MFAVHLDGSMVVLHDPQAGLAVPIIVDLQTGNAEIRLPPIAILAEDYVSFGSLADLKRSLRDYNSLIDHATRFSRYYTRRFKAEIDRGENTLRQLRVMILDDYRTNANEAKAFVGEIDRSKGFFHMWSGIGPDQARSRNYMLADSVG